MIKLIKHVISMDYDEPPTNMIKMIAYLRRHLELIPEKFRDSATLDIDVGDAYIEYDMYFIREETKEDVEERVKKEKKDDEICMRNDLRGLVGLKAEYPDK